MASFRDFSRGVVRGGGGGQAAATTTDFTTNHTDVTLDIGGLFDFFNERSQDKADRNFLKKNAEDFGFTPEEIDDFSREDLRRLKSGLLQESVGAGVEGQATQNFLDLFNQVPQVEDILPGSAQENPTQSFIEEETLFRQNPPQIDKKAENNTALIDLLGLPGPVPREDNLLLNQINPQIPSLANPFDSISSPRTVEPENFGEFVDEASDPTLRPMQQIQDALIQLSPGDAARIQNDPIFGALLSMAQRRPQVGQLVQDKEGGLWNVTFNIDGSVKAQKKLDITKRVPSEKNTIKVLQIQREDGSLGMDAVSIDNKGKIINQVEIPGAVPKTLKIDLGATKTTKAKIEKELISISTDLNELGRLRQSLFTTKGRPKELLTPLGRTKAFFFELADRAGALDSDLPLGAVVKNLEKLTGSKVQKEMVARVQEFRRVENQVGKIFTKFRKEITGVAGPPEEFERLEAISLSIRKLGPIGLDAAIQVLEDSKRDQQELLRNVFLANNKEEFLQALGGRMDSRIEGLRIKFRDKPAFLDAINQADIAKIQEQEIRRDIVGEERQFTRDNVPQSLIDSLNSLE